MTIRPLVAGLALAASGCAPEAKNDLAWVGSVGPESVEGRVRVVGSQPFERPLIEPETGEPRVVIGPYENELKRLSGAVVRVTGRFVEGRLPETALEGSSYEILSVDGDRPVIGRLVRDDVGFFLEARGGVVRRVGVVSDPLSERVGSLIWAVLDEYDGVARYGILRDSTE